MIWLNCPTTEVTHLFKLKTRITISDWFKFIIISSKAKTAKRDLKIIKKLAIAKEMRRFTSINMCKLELKKNKIGMITINDYSADAVKSIKENLKLNKLKIKN